MTSASVHEALDVLGRTAGWLARGGNAARARYVEATLMRWADRVAESPDVAEPVERIRARIAGFDAEPAEARQTRASEILAEIEALRARVGEAPIEVAPRAVLLPEGVSSDLPPRPPPVPEPVQVAEPALAGEPAAEARREERPRRDDRRD
ncbi:MAG: hypothetical protein ACOZNI_06275, partial [Myxococcota bacterium]